MIVVTEAQHMARERAIWELLPATRSELLDRLPWSFVTVQKYLRRMAKAGWIVRSLAPPKAGGWGRRSTRPPVLFSRAPGVVLPTVNVAALNLGKQGVEDEDVPAPLPRRVGRAVAGSGVIAGKPYRTGFRWGAGPA